MRISNFPEFSFSVGNKKMGHVGSFSVLPGVTCKKGVPCYRDCYARKMCRVYPSVNTAYSDNTKALMEDGKYSEFVEAACLFIKKEDFHMFRFNVSGDFFSAEYIAACCEIARRCKGVKFMAFTKQFDIATDAIKRGIVPKNFNIVFSAWNEFIPENPHLLPVAYFDDGKHSELIPASAKLCSGDCITCKKCFRLKGGQSVKFKKH